MDTTLSEPPARRTRRRHGPEFRASVIQAASQPGISMAAVALANGLNANMLRKWVAESQAGDPPGARSQSKALATTAASSQAFVPLTLTVRAARVDDVNNVPTPSTTYGQVQLTASYRFRYP